MFLESTESMVKTLHSVRLDEKILEKLNLESKEKRIPLSRIINNILQEHVNLDSDITRGGFVAIRRLVLHQFLHELGEKKLKEIAIRVAEVEGPEILISLRNQIDSVPLLDWVENWIKIAGYQYKHDVTSGIHYYLVNHNMGHKWSVYLSIVWPLIFKKFLGINKINFEIGENTIAFKVAVNPKIR